MWSRQIVLIYYSFDFVGGVPFTNASIYLIPRRPLEVATMDKSSLRPGFRSYIQIFDRPGWNI